MFCFDGLGVPQFRILLAQYLAFKYEHLYTDEAVGGFGFCKPIVDVRSQCVQGNPALFTKYRRSFPVAGEAGGVDRSQFLEYELSIAVRLAQGPFGAPFFFAEPAYVSAVGPAVKAPPVDPRRPVIVQSKNGMDVRDRVIMVYPRRGAPNAGLQRHDVDVVVLPVKAGPGDPENAPVIEDGGGMTGRESACRQSAGGVNLSVTPTLNRPSFLSLPMTAAALLGRKI